MGCGCGRKRNQTGGSLTQHQLAKKKKMLTRRKMKNLQIMKKRMGRRA